MFFSITGLIIVVIFGLLIYFWLIKDSEIIESIVFSVGFGLGILGVLLFIENICFKISFGFSNALTILIIFLIIDIFIIINIRNLLLKHLERFYSKIKSTNFNISKTEAILLTLIILISIIIFYKVVLLPINTGDALESWANFSKNFFNQREIPTEIGSFLKNLSAYPNLFSIQVSWLYFLDGKVNDIWMRILSFVYFMLAILVVYRLGHEYLKKREWALLAIFFLFINTIFINSTIRMNNQQPVLFYVITSYYFFDKFFNTKNLNFLFISGMFVGFAAFVKYNAEPFVVAICSIFLLILIFNSRLDKNSKYNIKEISRKKMFIFFLVPIFLLTALWIGRNLYYYHGPFYPKLIGGTHAIIPFSPEEGISLFNIFKNRFIKQGSVFMNFNFFILFLFVLSFIKNFKNNIFRPEFYCIFMTYILFLPITIGSVQIGSIARHLTIILPLMCIIAVKSLIDIFEDPNRKSTRYLFIGLIFLLLTYLTTSFIGGEKGLSIHFMTGDMSLIALLLLFFYTILKNRQRHIRSKNIRYKVLVYPIIIILIIPSFLFALQWKYSQTTDKFPYIKFSYSSKEEVIDYRLGKGAYEFRRWVNSNVNRSEKILGFINHIYYFDNDFVMPDDKILQDIYITDNLSEALLTLNNLNINYIIDATNVTRDVRYLAYFNKTIISHNLNNEKYFKLLYNKNNYKLYQIRF